MGWRVSSRQDGKVVQVKRRSCARVSNECKCRLVVLDERMAQIKELTSMTRLDLAERVR
jgi:hypothetical protein